MSLKQLQVSSKGSMVKMALKSRPSSFCLPSSDSESDLEKLLAGPRPGRKVEQDAKSDDLSLPSDVESEPLVVNLYSAFTFMFVSF